MTAGRIAAEIGIDHAADAVRRAERRSVEPGEIGLVLRSRMVQRREDDALLRLEMKGDDAVGTFRLGCRFMFETGTHAVSDFSVLREIEV